MVLLTLAYNKSATRKIKRLAKTIISKDTHVSYVYASHILKSRFKLGEKAISRSPNTSYLYASKVLKSRFKLGEKSISKSPDLSKKYIVYILKQKEIESFLKECSVEVLEYLINQEEFDRNKSVIIKILFKKKILNNE